MALLIVYLQTTFFDALDGVQVMIFIVWRTDLQIWQVSNSVTSLGNTSPIGTLT
jgi:hypothetical protein